MEKRVEYIRQEIRVLNQALTLVNEIDSLYIKEMIKEKEKYIRLMRMQD